jgi:hypothetical protein
MKESKIALRSGIPRYGGVGPKRFVGKYRVCNEVWGRWKLGYNENTWKDIKRIKKSTRDIFARA